ncbi:MAG: hypothetical protein Q4C45_00710 [Oscillospiraceae bacterium]|nr:hypothetical protein [Oscillospiraceae bacterium]
MSDCSGCGGCCGGGCGGCHGALLLTREEIDLLLYFAQIPFLPVARRSGSEEPVYRGDGEKPAEETARVITALWQKRLIRLDYDLPLLNFDYAAYSDCPVKGSMALTAMGQQVVEQLEIQGIEP